MTPHPQKKKGKKKKILEEAGHIYLEHLWKRGWNRVFIKFFKKICYNLIWFIYFDVLMSKMIFKK